DLEDQFLLAQPAEPLDAQVLGDVVQLGDGLVFEFGQIHPLASCPSVLRRTTLGGYSRPWNALGATLRDGRLRGMSCTCELCTESSTGLTSPICHTLSVSVNLIL